MAKGPILITGAGSGIGLSAARRLDAEGYSLILVFRPGAASPSDGWSERVSFERCDLSSPQEIEGLIARLKARYASLETVFSNAAVQPWRCERTKDGLESGFATAVLGTYLLVRGLTPLLSVGERPLVVVTGSLVHAWGRYSFDDLATGKGFDPNKTYYANKLCQMQLVTYFSGALKRERIAVHALEPGMTRTRFARSFHGFYRFMSIIWRPFMRAPEDVAADLFGLIRRNDLLETSGTNWLRGQPRPLSSAAADPIASAALAEALAALAQRLPLRHENT